MIRVYFVYEDPLDESGVNLSFADVPTQDPGDAVMRVQEAAETGELWASMYPDEDSHPHRLIKAKMSYLDISALPHEWSEDTILAV